MAATRPGPTITGAITTEWARRVTAKLTQEQQATAQKLHQRLRCASQRPAPAALQSKRYGTMRCSRRKKPDSGRLKLSAQEMEGLRQKLDQQRVKFDVALAEAGVPRGAGNGMQRLPAVTAVVVGA
ncbi:periplasmic heavy metal sensor [Klebsiella variicola subsp. variicola]|nr:periplasmic heavy metal sensor [Klebsiella variicola subsp. variicola]